MLKTANGTSYNAALLLPHKTRDELSNKLKSIGFIRELTENQISNLMKISQLPGAATFSVLEPERQRRL